MEFELIGLPSQHHTDLTDKTVCVFYPLGKTPVAVSHPTTMFDGTSKHLKANLLADHYPDFNSLDTANLILGGLLIVWELECAELMADLVHFLCFHADEHDGAGADLVGMCGGILHVSLDWDNLTISGAPGINIRYEHPALEGQPPPLEDTSLMEPLYSH